MQLFFIGLKYDSATLLIFMLVDERVYASFTRLNDTYLE